MRAGCACSTLAVTTAALRTALAADGDPKWPEALLRYYARKPSPSDADRDLKTDFAGERSCINGIRAWPGSWETRRRLAIERRDADVAVWKLR